MRRVIRGKGEGLLETDDKGCKSHFLEPQGLLSLKYEFFRKKITAAKSVQNFAFSKTNLFHSQTLPLRHSSGISQAYLRNILGLYQIIPDICHAYLRFRASASII